MVNEVAMVVEKLAGRQGGRAGVFGGVIETEIMGEVGEVGEVDASVRGQSRQRGTEHKGGNRED